MKFIVLLGAVALALFAFGKPSFQAVQDRIKARTETPDTVKEPKETPVTLGSFIPSNKQKIINSIGKMNRIGAREE